MIARRLGKLLGIAALLALVGLGAERDASDHRAEGLRKRDTPEVLDDYVPSAPGVVGVSGGPDCSTPAFWDPFHPTAPVHDHLDDEVRAT